MDDLAATFLLIRHAAHVHLHGTLTGRLDGVPLSDEGRTQSVRLAERLLKVGPINHLVTSPRERARATAASVATRHRLPAPEVNQAFDEIDFGDWTGKRFADLDRDAAWERWNVARGEGCPPGGEPAAVAQARAVLGLRQLAARHTGAVIAVVSHADIIRSVVCAAIDLPLDHILRFDCAPASVTRITLFDHGGVLHTLNEGTD